MKNNLLLLFMCIAQLLSAQAKDSVYTFQSIAGLYKQLDAKIKVNHTPVPIYSKGVETPIFSLNGDWMFTTDTEDTFNGLKNDSFDWHVLSVPSEWYMESFTVEKNKWAGYYKEFTIPADWDGKRTLIRFGAVESACKVYLNGSFIGEHQGSMTQFEMELTPHLSKGTNKLFVYVCSESLSSSVSRISHYAKHQVGGLIRGIDLISVPKEHISNFYCDALLTDDLKTGKLILFSELSKKRSRLTYDVVVRERGIEGLSCSGKEVYRSKRTIKKLADEIVIPSPQLWHAESPFLYTVELSLYDKNTCIETVHKNIGFRKIEIRGNSLFVNHKQVKLRGVARHDITAYDGRAIKDTALLRKDMEQLRNANCNFIRTSHYPPDAYMLDLCDQLGLFVEDEAAVCWDRNPDTDAYVRSVFYNFKSMLVRDRSHPSILLWSIGNESKWSPKFFSCMEFAKTFTPHIPVKFSHSEYQGIKKGPDIGAKHYPGWRGLMRYDNYFRPMLFGEALHLNCYNTSENITDPGLRDLWGDYVSYFVDNMQESPAVAGLALWGAIDEMFYPKDNAPCGYGPWGVVDGFRREKPEFWHMKMAFAPIIVTSKHFQSINNGTLVSVENRYNVQNANQVDILWKDIDKEGVVHSDVAAMEQGVIYIPHQMKGDTLSLIIRDRRGFDISAWKIPRKYMSHYPMPALATTGNVEVSVSDSSYQIQVKDICYSFSRTTGTLNSATRAGKPVLAGPLNMYLIPLLKENEVIDYIPQERKEGSIVRFTSDSLTDWKMKSEVLEEINTGVRITVRGTYGKAPVEFVYLIDADGRFRVDYLLNIKTIDYSIRQIGVGFQLPKEYRTLSWKRKALWSVYPQDHIGRTEGEAKAFYPETLMNYRKERTIPMHSYAEEGNEFGSNDFRSTKHGIINCRLISEDRSESLSIESNSRQHVRAWILPDYTAFLVANYSNGGNEHYLNYDSDRTKFGLGGDGGDVTGWIQLNLE